MVTNAADNEANPFEGKIYSSGYAYFENAVAVNHVVYRYMPETDSVLAECIDLNSTLKKHMTLTIEKSVLGKPVTRIGGYFTDPYYMDAKIGYLFDKIYIHIKHSSCLIGRFYLPLSKIIRTWKLSGRAES